MSRSSRRQSPKQEPVAKASPQLGQDISVTDLFNRAATDHQNGRLSEAEAGYRQVLAIDPRHPATLHNLGLIAFKLGKAEAAIDLFEKALLAQPRFAGAFVSKGHVLKETGHLDDAVSAYREALRLEPGNTIAHNNLGIALQTMGRLDEAVACYRTLTRINPGHAGGHAGLGSALLELNRADDAIEHLQKALSLMPAYANAHSNLGVAYRACRKLNEAAACFREALQIDPNLKEAHFNLSLALLLQGKMNEAWPEFEWRWYSAKNANLEPEKPRDFPQPTWDGDDAGDKAILVWGEQGIGDEIMFASMVPDLVGTGARVILECESRLVPLFQRSFPTVQCIGRTTPPDPMALAPEVTRQIAAGSLGRFFRPDEASFPDRRSYLVADPNRRAELRRRYLKDGDAVLVGVSWSSSNKMTGTDRSVCLADFSSLIATPGIRAVNLQYGDTAAERQSFEADSGLSILHDAEVDSLRDLDSFAAQVAAMDVVVSIDNSTVHLSGALGIPTLILIPRFASLGRWQWMLDRRDNPWYSSVQLIRRSDTEPWSEVIARAESALRDFMEIRR